MKNFITILIGFFMSFASVALPHPVTHQGIEDSDLSFYSLDEQTMEALKTEPFQVVFLDQEGTCFTYHSTSGDVSACDIQAENLVHNMFAEAGLNNISKESDLFQLQSKGVVPIGQTAHVVDEELCETLESLDSLVMAAAVGGFLGIAGAIGVAKGGALVGLIPVAVLLGKGAIVGAVAGGTIIILLGMFTYAVECRR